MSVIASQDPGERLSGRRLAIVSAAWCVGALFCIAFAVMAALFPLAVASDTHDIWASIQGAFTSADYSFGPRSSEAQHPIYSHALRSLSLHTIAGGAALLAATTQFIPRVRRRWPVIHRAMGALVVLLVAASMIGSIIVQMSHPLSASLSGAGFGIGLMSLCGLTLSELTLAILAIRARDYRSHMGWMALTFASLLTAPALRAQWLLFGATGLKLDEVNLVVAMFLVPETILLMSCWMLSVGKRDLGFHEPRSILPTAVLRILAILATIVALNEGCLGPFGLDLIHAWRDGAHPLPRSSVFWGLATGTLALRAPRDLMRLEQGLPLRATTIACAICVAATSLLVAFTLDEGDLQSLAQRSFYAACAVELTLLILLGRCAAFGHVAPWDTQWLYLAFAPALWPTLAFSYVPLAVGGPIATTTAMAIAYATIAMLGFASAFGLRFAIRTRRSSATVGIAAAN